MEIVKSPNGTEIVNVSNAKELAKSFNSIIASKNAMHGWNMALIEDIWFCKTAYYGCGHHLYVFVKDWAFRSADIIKIMDDFWEEPALMANALKEKDSFAKVVVHDVEMGGVSVW